jgi:O-antigen/teichoic acid export membrane protein
VWRAKLPSLFFFVSKPPVYPLNPFNSILFPRISRNVSKAGEVSSERSQSENECIVSVS